MFIYTTCLSLNRPLYIDLNIFRRGKGEERGGGEREESAANFAIKEIKSRRDLLVIERKQTRRRRREKREKIKVFLLFLLYFFLDKKEYIIYKELYRTG
jgi:hypothetical protein